MVSNRKFIFTSGCALWNRCRTSNTNISAPSLLVCILFNGTSIFPASSLIAGRFLSELFISCVIYSFITITIKSQRCHPPCLMRQFRSSFQTPVYKQSAPARQWHQRHGRGSDLRDRHFLWKLLSGSTIFEHQLFKHIQPHTTTSTMRTRRPLGKKTANYSKNGRGKRDV